uniref:Uncharacterized protein n=1 Tax=Anguilla anguilla TaxID=7936 RepID=A0A0E9QEX3_ANGAN
MCHACKIHVSYLIMPCVLHCLYIYVRNHAGFNPSSSFDIYLRKSFVKMFREKN